MSELSSSAASEICLGPAMAEYYRTIGIGDQTLFNVDIETAIAEDPGCVGVLSLDGNKVGRINKIDGKLAGDEHMRQVGNTLIQNVRDAEGREADSVYNLGGDEYAVIMRGIKTQADVDDGAIRLTKIFQQHGSGMTIGGKIHLPGMSAHTLYTIADKQMQDIKKENRLLRNIGSGEKFVASKMILALAAKYDLDLKDLDILQDEITVIPNEFLAELVLE